VADKGGEELAELEEEVLAGLVLVGEHVEGPSPIPSLKVRDEGFEVFFFEQGGTGDGDGFVAGTHQGHAVGDALGDEEGFARLELLQYGEVEDVTPATLGELEPGDPLVPP